MGETSAAHRLVQSSDERHISIEELFATVLREEEEMETHRQNLSCTAQTRLNVMAWLLGRKVAR